MNIETTVKKASLAEVAAWAKRLKLNTELPTDKLRRLIVKKADKSFFTATETRERAELRQVVDPKTGRTIQQPLGCFGWAYDSKDTLCTKDCVYSGECKKLTADAPRLLKEVREESLVDAAIKRVSKKEAEEIASALKREPVKLDQKAAVKTVGLETSYRVTFDEDVIDSLDDKDSRVLYRKVLKRFRTKSFTVRDFKKLLEDLDYEVTDDEVLEQLDVRAANGDFERVES